MSASFTPGPWAAIPMVTDADNAFYIEGNRDAHNYVKDIATVGPCLSPQTKANAHLIAAAPDLYEACAAMVRLSQMGLEESLREPEENGNYAAFNRAVAALAKARGEQNV